MAKAKAKVAPKISVKARKQAIADEAAAAKREAARKAAEPAPSVAKPEPAKPVVAAAPKIDKEDALFATLPVQTQEVIRAQRKEQT